jgi:hypothetical protein
MAHLFFESAIFTQLYGLNSYPLESSNVPFFKYIKVIILELLFL